MHAYVSPSWVDQTPVYGSELVPVQLCSARGPRERHERWADSSQLPPAVRQSGIGTAILIVPSYHSGGSHKSSLRGARYNLSVPAQRHYCGSFSSNSLGTFASPNESMGMFLALLSWCAGR